MLIEFPPLTLFFCSRVAEEAAGLREGWNSRWLTLARGSKRNSISSSNRTTRESFSFLWFASFALACSLFFFLLPPLAPARFSSIHPFRLAFAFLRRFTIIDADASCPACLYLAFLRFSFILVPPSFPRRGCCRTTTLLTLLRSNRFELPYPRKRKVGIVCSRRPLVPNNASNASSLRESERARGCTDNETTVGESLVVIGSNLLLDIVGVAIQRGCEISGAFDVSYKTL